MDMIKRAMMSINIPHAKQKNKIKKQNKRIKKKGKEKKMIPTNFSG